MGKQPAASAAVLALDGGRRRKPGWQPRVRAGALALSLLLPLPATALDSPSGLAPGDRFRTEEYRASWALEAIHAADAYALGYTGKGVRVAVVDNGDLLSHSEFVGRTTPWPQGAARRSTAVGAVGAHSMEVSSLVAAAKDGRGMHGVAYDAVLMSFGYEAMVIQTPAAIRDAVDGGARVINGSYGFEVYPSAYRDDGSGNITLRPQSVQTFLLHSDGGGLGFHSDEAEALRYAAAHDVISVYAAGNDYIEHPLAARHPSSIGVLPYVRPGNHVSGVYRIADSELIYSDPEHGDDYVSIDPSDSRLQGLEFSDLEATMIAVVAVDRNTRIASYSNACGVAWRWCIAAPGGDAPRGGQSWDAVGMYTPQLDGSYSAHGVVGTSFAAPMVSGALAVTRQAFPYMTMRQVREIVLTSANRAGHLADRAVYGWGLLDLGRAVRGPVVFGAEGFAPIFDVDTQGHDSWWSNDIEGPGGLIKRGAGLLAVTGNNTYAGPTTVKGGALAVYGSIARSALKVERGGTLVGSGTVGPTEVAGTVAPGNPGAALRVAGDYVQQAESVYVAGIGPDGAASDRIQVQGAARIDSAVLQVDGIGPNAVNREYTVLQADGGIQGGYAKVHDPYLYLDLGQGIRGNDSTRYRFWVRRNAAPFAAAAQTSNQRSVARALDTAGIGVAPYGATVMATRPDALPRRFDRWSGEAHASVLGALTMQAGQVRDGMLGRARVMDGSGGEGVGNSGGGSGERISDRRGWGGSGAGIGDASASSQSQSVVQDDTGKAVWAQYVGSRDRTSSDCNAAGMDAASSGLLFGTDMPLRGQAVGGPRLGLMAGFTGGHIGVDDRGSNARVDSYTLGAYGTAPVRLYDGGAPAVQLRYGASYTRYSVSAKRDTAGLETAEGRYKAGTAQVFTEAGLPYAVGAATVEPYAGLAYVDTRRRAFSESGNAGLHAGAARQQLVYSTLGLRADTGWDLRDGSRLSLHGGVGWRHAYGNVTPVSRMRFAEGDGFNVQGTPVGRDAMLLEAGARVYSDRGMRLSLGYTGQLARRAQSHAVKANAIWMF